MARFQVRNLDIDQGLYDRIKSVEGNWNRNPTLACDNKPRTPTGIGPYLEGQDRQAPFSKYNSRFASIIQIFLDVLHRTEI